MLQNEPLAVKKLVDTAENGPLQSPKSRVCGAGSVLRVLFPVDLKIHNAICSQQFWSSVFFSILPSTTLHIFSDFALNNFPRF